MSYWYQQSKYQKKFPLAKTNYIFPTRDVGAKKLQTDVKIADECSEDVRIAVLNVKIKIIAKNRKPNKNSPLNLPNSFTAGIIAEKRCKNSVESGKKILR